ncbi:MAG: DUF2062 domain-containing protein [bacterium]|nr:DUF2062 domain-containing protein [Candidatus Colisoma equi]
MVGDPLPPEDVAAGWALGMFIGCSIPFGLQLLVSIPLAIMMRVSKIGATVGTLITNPVTIFFIYPTQTWVMYNLLFGNREMGELPTEWTRQSVMALSGPVIISFFLGGLALALILSPITYFTVKRIVIKYRQRRGSR